MRNATVNGLPGATPETSETSWTVTAPLVAGEDSLADSQRGRISRKPSSRESFIEAVRVAGQRDISTVLSSRELGKPRSRVAGVSGEIGPARHSARLGGAGH